MENMNGSNPPPPAPEPAGVPAEDIASKMAYLINKVEQLQKVNEALAAKPGGGDEGAAGTTNKRRTSEAGGGGDDKRFKPGGNDDDVDFTADDMECDFGGGSKTYAPAVDPVKAFEQQATRGPGAGPRPLLADPVDHPGVAPWNRPPKEDLTKDRGVWDWARTEQVLKRCAKAKLRGVEEVSYRGKESVSLAEVSL
jgi:hypothetical protein